MGGRVNDTARLRWQCRRGMRELDILLLGWFDEGFGAASTGQKSAFRELLMLPDPEIAGYLLGGEIPDETELADVVSSILDRARAS